MRKRKKWYLLLLLVTLYLVIMYYYSGLRFLLALELLFLPISWIYLWICHFMCKAELICKESQHPREEEWKAEIQIKNKGWLPIARIKLYFEWTAPEKKSKRIETEIIGLDGLAEKVVPICLEAQHCGKAVLKMKKICYYDYLGVCNVISRKKKQLEIWITPKIEILDTYQLETVFSSEMEFHQEADDMGGYEIREYRPGDSLHRVYWKLSAREEDLQIRDFERESEIGAEVFLDFYRDNSFVMKDSKDRNRWDCYLDKAFSLLFTMFYYKNSLKFISWLENGEYNRQEIHQEEDIYICMYRLLSIEINNTEYLSDIENRERERIRELGTMYFNMDCYLYAGSKLLIAL